MSKKRIYFVPQHIQWDSCERATSYTIKRGDTVIASKITSLTYTDTSLTPNTEYSYEIIAENESGTSSVIKQIRTKCEKPATPVISELGRYITHINISWNQVQGASGYEVKCGDVVYDTGENTQFDNKGLTSNTYYTYKVRAKNIDEIGDWSESITIKTKPSIPKVPSSIQLSSTDMTINISWDNIDEAESYIINIDGQDLAVSTINSCTYAFDSSVEAESIHTVKVKATNESGNSDYSSIYSIKLQPKLTDAPELSALVENTYITLSWNTLENVNYYEIERDTETCITASAITASYVDTEVSLEQAHTYKIRAIFEDKEGSWSYPVEIKSLPLVPENFIGVPGYSVITLQWSESVGAGTYELYANENLIYTGPNTYYEHVVGAGCEAYQYKIRAKNNTGYSNMSDVLNIAVKQETTNVPQNIKHILDNNYAIITWNSVENAQGYMIKINGGQSQYVIEPTISFSVTPEAICAVKVAAVMDKDNSLTGEWSQEITFYGPVSAPLIPTNIQCTNIDSTVQLSWSKVDNATDYDVQIDGNRIIRITDNTFTEDNLPYETTRRYRIRSHNQTGVSEWSEEITITTGQALPGTPLNIICTNVANSTNISINWEDVDGALSYEISIIDGNTFTSTQSEITLTGLESGKQYQVKIRAITPSGEGPWSNIVYCISSIPAPQNLAIISSTNDGVALSWNTVSGAVNYDLEVDGVIVATVTENNTILSNICSHINHNIRVRANNNIKNGEWSSLVILDSNEAEQITVVKNEKISLMMPVSNVSNIGKYKMTIAINTDELGLLDAYGYTSITETGTTYILNSNIQITIEKVDNMCYISIFVDDNDTRSITGVINSIKLIAKKDCTASISYQVTLLQ